jgi:hypothetical protein
MNTSSMSRRAARPARSERTTHLFAVGQAVRLKGGFGLRPQSSEIYHITGTLPPRGDSPQYRIRNDDERHERVTTQDSLELVRAASGGEGPALIERTFGHVQGSERQHSPVQEAEAGIDSVQA